MRRVGPGRGVTGGQALAELLERSDERDRYMERIDQAWRDGYRRGDEDGYARGRQDEGTERDQAWDRIARPASRAAPFREFERRRWAVRGEPRTRETFSQPHPGDYQGRKGAA